jgi:hypothetical protein
MLRRAVFLGRAIERARIDFFPGNPYLALAICVSICLGACVSFEKQSSDSAPLAAAELRLRRAERQKPDVNAQAGEYLAVAIIAKRQLNSTSASKTSRSSAIALYNRATADLASDLPAVIDRQRNSKTLVLKNSGTGETERLHLQSGERGQYDATYFQKILVADQINQKHMQKHATREGLGGTVVGVHHGAKTGEPVPRLEPLKGIRATMTAIVHADQSHPGDASLQLLDPTKLDMVVLNKKSYTLAGDYTAAQACGFVRSAEKREARFSQSAGNGSRASVRHVGAIGPRRESEQLGARRVNRQRRIRFYQAGGRIRQNSDCRGPLPPPQCLNRERP